MSAFEELKNRTGGTDGATPLEWCVVEMHKSYNPKRAEQAAAELSALRAERDEAVKLLESFLIVSHIVKITRLPGPVDAERPVMVIVEDVKNAK